MDCCPDQCFFVIIFPTCAFLALQGRKRQLFIKDFVVSFDADHKLIALTYLGDQHN